MTDLDFANLHADHFAYITSPVAGHPLYHQR
jgi:hypothetical protein